MEGFTIIDGVVAAIIVISALLAYSRGFVREAMAIAGWIGAAILAFIFSDQVEPLVKQIPVLGDFIGDSCELSIIGAFALVFAVTLVVVSIFTPLFSNLVQRSALGGLDQGAGFLFGVLRGILLVAVGFFGTKQCSALRISRWSKTAGLQRSLRNSHPVLRNATQKLPSAG